MKKINLIPYSPQRLDSTNYFRKKIKKIVQNKSIIDVGCGKLFFYSFLREINFKGTYFGIDIDPISKIHSTQSLKVSTKQIDFLKFNTKRKFDFASCLWVLEHIKKDEQTLNQINSLLKKDGLLLLAIPTIYSWPFEFGRHGYHYYSYARLSKMLKKSNLEIVDFYKSGGLGGFIFMLFYSWPRYFLLVPCLIIFKIGKILKLTNSSWKRFSAVFIANTMYYYHRYPNAIKFHNSVVKIIVKWDNKLKLFPASYIFLLKKS